MIAQKIGKYSSYWLAKEAAAIFTTINVEISNRVYWQFRMLCTVLLASICALPYALVLVINTKYSTALLHIEII